MVYGIINLINFAHGEVAEGGGADQLDRVTELRGTMPDWLLLIVSLIARDQSSAPPSTSRSRRSPTAAAQRAAPWRR
jgi:hypothetical protein